MLKIHTVICIIAEVVMCMPAYVVVVPIMRTGRADAARVPLVQVGTARVRFHFSLFDVDVIWLSVVKFLIG